MFSCDEMNTWIYNLSRLRWIFPKVLTNELKPEMRVVSKTESARRHGSCHWTAHRCVCNLKFILLIIIVIKTCPGMMSDTKAAETVQTDDLHHYWMNQLFETLTQPEEEDDENHHRCCGLRNACWDTRLTSASVTWTEPGSTLGISFKMAAGLTSGLNGVGGRDGWLFCPVSK